MSAPDTPVEAWVGCYTDPDGDQGLVSLTGSASALTQGKSGRLLSPSWLTPLDPAAGTWLAVSEEHDSALSVVDLSGPEAVTMASVPTGGVHACHVGLSPDRRWIAVAHYTSGSVALIPAPTGANLAPPVDLVTFAGRSAAIPDRQEGPHPHQIVWLDHTTVLVPDLGADLIRILQVDHGNAAKTGTRLVETAPIEVPAGTGPRHLVLRPPTEPRPDGDPLPDFAVVGELSGQVLSYRRQGVGWTLVDTAPTSGAPQAQPSGFRAFPDGATLVVANRVVNTLGLLTWDPAGQLTLVDELGCAGDHPRDVVVHESALWVANQHSDSVAVFTPTPSGWSHSTSVAVRTPACVVFPHQPTTP